MQSGTLNLHVISDGFWGLDAGAMFGMVPKTIWSKLPDVLVDERNRLYMGLNCLLIQDGKNNILIDAGLGKKFAPKFQDIYAVDQRKDLLASLNPYCKPEDINYLIFTHLHFDHAGGASYYNQTGQLKLTFPNADYIIQQKEWESAQNPDDKSQASYLSENLEPLQESGRVRLINGNYRFNAHIELILTGGHSLGHQMVKIRSYGQTWLFAGDIFPTQNHIKPIYLTAYDLEPLETVKHKKMILETAVRENWLFFWEHNYCNVIGKIIVQKGKYQVVPSEIG
ncbi:MAG: MBL fold metallo-hydrolase [Candidatus Schekmanbacteria bacterium]|nr:MBL fold metallo-hydrolase [Candidatus Schekmanbacteria bacterium]